MEGAGNRTCSVAEAEEVSTSREWVVRGCGYYVGEVVESELERKTALSFRCVCQVFRLSGWVGKPLSRGGSQTGLSRTGIVLSSHDGWFSRP